MTHLPLLPYIVSKKRQSLVGNDKWLSLFFLRVPNVIVSVESFIYSLECALRFGETLVPGVGDGQGMAGVAIGGSIKKNDDKGSITKDFDAKEHKGNSQVTNLLEKTNFRTGSSTKRGITKEQSKETTGGTIREALKANG
ncbi:hypothetical protein NPIL_380031 [Nephila pilipes]|uniref:Uncharacterized protein n=1 Tax=Nephila pilipes TaxID=299642 RepID=A0A8X6T4U4_NEPPI|nr:hypothetical protein NPIL_380031 [Nephila pilipes]